MYRQQKANKRMIVRMRLRQSGILTKSARHELAKILVDHIKGMWLVNDWEAVKGAYQIMRYQSDWFYTS
jgi:hypothetical protein